MPRLFLFAIGGTGARVLRALTHVLAAGAPLQDGSGAPVELVPLVIDPDADNFDTLECLKTLVAYTDVRNRHLDAAYEGSFFRTRISRYQELQAGAPADRLGSARPTFERDSFRCGIVDRERSQTFGEVIGYDHLRGKDKLVVDALYSPENLDTRLSGGFLGNPNLGTVVLNKVKSSDQFGMLPGLFHEEDRVFIISSIFGGTGASGFPVLVKLLRDAKDENGNAMTVLRKAPIGALTVLPYFSVKADRNSPIDSNAFIPKTKAALAYYAKHLGSVQALYYIGHKSRMEYLNTPTGAEQRNQNHVVEFLGASAVLSFVNGTFEAGVGRPRFYECATADSTEPAFSLSSFGDGLASTIGHPMTEFALATRFLQLALPPAELPRLLAQPWTKEGKFDSKFFATGQPGLPFHPIERYSQLWWAWLTDMGGNDPAFLPFSDNLETLRRDRGTVRITVNEMNKALNMLDGRASGERATLRRLLQMLSDASRHLCDAAYRRTAA